MAITFPSNPNTNDTHTVNGRTWVWDGAAWKLSGTINNGISLEVSDTAPATPIEGDMWYDSSTGSTFTYYDSVWVELGNTASVVSFIADSDGDTRVHVEESADEDTIRFDTAGTERLTITSAGHVLPSADVTYDLGSSSYRFRDLYLSGSSIDLGGVTISSDGTSLSMPPISSVSGDFTVDTSTLHVDSTNDRVGIGTTSPDGSLHIEKSLGTAANDTEILQRFKSNVGSNTSFLTVSNIRESSGGSSWDSAHHRIQHRVDSSEMAYIDFNPESAARGLALGTDNVERVTINSSGNVGIGTSSPDFSLDVAGQAIVGGGDNQTPDALGNGHLMIDGNGYTGFASLDGTAMWVGHNSGSRKLYLATDETARLTVDGSGNVGIGTNSPSSLLELSAPSSVLSITDSDGTLGGSMSAMVYYKDSAGNIQGQIGYGTATGFMIVDNNDGPMRVGTASADSLYLRTNNADQITVNSAGNVTFAGHLTVSGDLITMAGASSRDKYRVWNSSYYTIGMQSSHNFGALGDYAMTFQMNSDANRGWWWGDSAHTNSQGAMSLTTIGQLTIANSIRVGFGESDTTAPGTANGVQANGGFYSNSSYVSRPGASATGFYLNPQLTNTGGGRALDIRACSDSSSAPFQFLTGNAFAFVTDGTTRLTIDNNGISKSGGSFDIQHPLDADDSTSRLRHGFVESPYNDNMYRGTVTLDENGQAVIDLDSHYGMRDGTWMALNTNPWVIASVNGGSSVNWDLVGKTLTLTGTSGESVQWLVIGERHDPHVMSEKNSHTDENGRLILEYTREWEDEDGWTPPHLLEEGVE